MQDATFLVFVEGLPNGHLMVVGAECTYRCVCVCVCVCGCVCVGGEGGSLYN